MDSVRSITLVWKAGFVEESRYAFVEVSEVRMRRVAGSKPRSHGRGNLLSSTRVRNGVVSAVAEQEVPPGTYMVSWIGKRKPSPYNYGLWRGVLASSAETSCSAVAGTVI